RLPRKVLRPLAGKPLLQWVWEAAGASTAQQMIVATDDAGVLDACRAFGADADTTAYALAYLHWFIPSMALQFPLMIMGSALGGTGNMKPGTLAQIGSAILNMVLAPLLIFGWLGLPRLGVAGAGLATF
ncbi:hypothetical protein LWS67_21855, partial [Bacillus atrophaeus]|uniref:cytidylyltransferase domain-containing protein n=1 Tax=Bacillus atrophaeus TaxID=1452 RepID=UPI0023BAE401